jgi:hypothetical protein
VFCRIVLKRCCGRLACLLQHRQAVLNNPVPLGLLSAHLLKLPCQFLTPRAFFVQCRKGYSLGPDLFDRFRLFLRRLLTFRGRLLMHNLYRLRGFLHVYVSADDF